MGNEEQESKRFWLVVRGTDQRTVLATCVQVEETFEVLETMRMNAFSDGELAVEPSSPENSGSAPTADSDPWMVLRFSGGRAVIVSIEDSLEKANGIINNGNHSLAASPVEKLNVGYAVMRIRREAANAFCLPIYPVPRNPLNPTTGSKGVSR